ncbi:M23 family metallopeptidase [Ancylothrix sp. C2]|uniref:M23 family metallopeptidase n=1 Tax=Ancylothrix sp. D3o TaxID=2953691 RepID=UPI0021BAEB6F|nr:M23 family metallopeptidase [Ancylothrix sp. D3o]MCT7953224.1 M23 family metallopeptidase [Ancylothrix sp. D3o]
MPTWEKIENLPPAQILRSIVNPTAAPPVPSSKQQSSILLHGPPVFPLAGLSGKKAIPVSIPGDCRPLGSCTRKHAGADYSASPGTPVLAVEGGTVNEVKPDSPVGGIIGIKSTSSDEIYRYVHLDRDSVRPFKVGDFVSKGSIIGKVGPTFPGSSGPHLHIERYQAGQLDWKVHEHLKTAIALPKP